MVTVLPVVVLPVVPVVADVEVVLEGLVVDTVVVVVPVPKFVCNFLVVFN